MPIRRFTVLSDGVGTAGTSPEWVRYRYAADGSDAAPAPAIAAVSAGNAPGLYAFTHSVTADVYGVIDLDPGGVIPLIGDARYLHVLLTPDDDAITEARQALIVAAVTQGNFRIKNPTHNAQGKLTGGSLVFYASAADAANDENAVATTTLTAAYDGDGNMTSYLGQQA